MIYSDTLQALKSFNIIINSKYEVEVVSNNILESEIDRAFFNVNLRNLFSEKMMFDDLKNGKAIVKISDFNICEMIHEVFEGKNINNRKIIVRLNSGSKEMDYAFFFSANLLISNYDNFEKKKVSIYVRDYKKFDSVEERYINHFEEFEEKFDLVKKMNVIGRFIIDLELDKYKAYGNEALPELLELTKTEDNLYQLNSRNSDKLLDNTIIKSKQFYDRVDLLLARKIDLLTDEWKVSDKWLRLEAKVLTETSEGLPRIIGGLVYDATYFQKYKDIESLHSFYELAISSGGIGMFHYDLEDHDSSVFTANEIYAGLFGMDPDENGFYKSSDFLKAQLPLEKNISKYESVNIQLDKLIKGEVDGTTDDVIKIRNLKTGEIKYLLSSSKVYSHFDDGKSKVVGGIVIDITDRIIRERNQVEFLYKDELTLLGNNRALAKNMLDANNGLGLFFDLDNFKKINDTYGHLMGDKMIKVFADSLDSVAKEYENITVYRLYGDEFFVFCETRHKSFASIYERKVKEHLLIKMKTIEEDIHLDASMGSALYKKGTDIDEFIKTADYAMYEAKISKKKREN